MLVMQVAEHSPETCPAFMDRYRAVTLRWFEKVESNCAKFGVKMIGFWTDHPAHRVYMLFETPSMDAMMGLMMTPETQSMMSFQKIRSFPVFDFKQTWDMIKGAK
ncbi:MAG: hypothetical protein A4E32_00003 [Methanomassiliicoccales archaeon PtaU1.Bin124]|nr:MAG: hypothetical protein A4E32_00003 [Methanomassiliicoccales archaeon PtaU1.Bin124]